MALSPSILLPVTAWCLFITCLSSILLTSSSTSYDGIKKEQWYNKFVRGVQVQKPSSLENVWLQILNSLLAYSTSSCTIFSLLAYLVSSSVRSASKVSLLEFFMSLFDTESIFLLIFDFLESYSKESASTSISLLAFLMPSSFS